MKPICLLVTGPAHAGTRLPVEMFNKHPDVSVPMSALKLEGELRAWIPFFVEALDRTPLYSDEYAIDRNEVNFILDAYMESVDTSKRWFLLKLPYYPLNCLDYFVDYFDGSIVLLFNCRPFEKIFRSYVNRGEDRSLFTDNYVEQVRQIKKLPAAQRKQHLVHPDAKTFFEALYNHCEVLRDQWDTAHPERKFIDVDVEKIAASREYLVELLENIGLPASGANDMLSVVDRDRLLHHRSQTSRPSELKAIVRSLTPPLIWEMAARLKNR